MPEPQIFYTNEQFSNKYVEIRPWLQVIARWHKKIFRYTDKSTDQNTRLGFRIGGTFTLTNYFIQVKTWYIPFRFEMFLNVGGEAKDVSAEQNRAKVGIG